MFLEINILRIEYLKTIFCNDAKNGWWKIKNIDYFCLEVEDDVSSAEVQLTSNKLQDIRKKGEDFGLLFFFFTVSFHG